MISARTIARKAACAFFLVQLSGCCCCDAGLFEEFGEGFEQGFNEEMERQAQEMEQKAKKMESEAKKMEKSAKKLSGQQREIHEKMKSAVAKGTFVDDGLETYKLEDAKIEFVAQKKPGEITAVFTGKHYGKKFTARFEGEVKELTGIFNMETVKGPKLKAQGSARDGHVRGAVTGKINGKQIGVAFDAVPPKK